MTPVASDPPSIAIQPAQTPLEIDHARQLFQEYQDFLNVDLCFQGFEAELASLPGAYAPPQGALLLAWDLQRSPDLPVGCVAVRPLKGGAPALCEMKRLYVRPDWLGAGVGRQLAQAIVTVARDLGYDRMVLDTLERLDKAVRLYRKMGFYDIQPYYDNPIAGVIYLECKL